MKEEIRKDGTADKKPKTEGPLAEKDEVKAAEERTRKATATAGKKK